MSTAYGTGGCGCCNPCSCCDCTCNELLCTLSNLEVLDSGIWVTPAGSWNDNTLLLSATGDLCAYASQFDSANPAAQFCFDGDCVGLGYQANFGSSGGGNGFSIDSCSAVIFPAGCWSINENEEGHHVSSISNLYGPYIVSQTCDPFELVVNMEGTLHVGGPYSETEFRYRATFTCNDPPPLMMAARGSMVTAPAKWPDCAGRELLAGEIAGLKLDTRCRWFACSTGQHKAHKLCSKGKDAHAPDAR